MTKGTVGASIVSIITESLYDKPIVVFREYIQNAVDALGKGDSKKYREDYSAQIWVEENNLYFLDNGTGIQRENFEHTMTTIAQSPKSRVENIGYKGIGRLSGIPYCKNLTFINIADYANRSFQEYVIDGDEYSKIRNDESYNEMEFSDLMSKIGTLNNQPDGDYILNLINGRKELFKNRNTGFLVIMQDISLVLRNVIEDAQFLENLGWLLPVPFREEMVNPSEPTNTYYELFTELSTSNPDDKYPVIPAKAFKIFCNGQLIERPLTNTMLRKYLCRSNFNQYAISVHTFSNDKILLDKKNPFSGIRIYIDNMLLCDENELIPALQQYGLLSHSTYEVIQSVRGIGAMIYIVDKVNISANARRTFIDITDEASIEFLTLIGEFVESIYTARYALSGYDSAKRKENANKEKLENLKERAIKALEDLARSDITLEVEDVPEPVKFQNLSKTEQKRFIKTKITKKINSNLRKFLSQTEDYNPDTCFEDFLTWVEAN